MGKGLKAVIFNFNGVIINDEALHQALLEKVLLEENIQLRFGEYREVGLGKSDRACFDNFLTSRGRAFTDATLDLLVQRKSQYYQNEITTLTPLPIYSGVEDIIFRFRALQLPLAIVSEAGRREIQIVLDRSGLATHFSVIVDGEDIPLNKPDPTGLLMAMEQLNRSFPTLGLEPSNCLVIEDTPAGIEAAKRAGMTVVGVANTYPYHMIQRQANWAVDYLNELELDRIQYCFEEESEAALSASAIE
ncbi:MAG: HAD family phosphatase [Cyanobacteria bacterium P01_F01_bin.150]